MSYFHVNANKTYNSNNVVLFITVFAKIPIKFKAPTLYKNTFSTNVLCSRSGLSKTQCSVEYPVAALTINPNILYGMPRPYNTNI